MSSSPDNWLQHRQDFCPSDDRSQNMTGQVASGTAWQGMSVGATSVLMLVRSMVFARLLTPEDFGIQAWAQMITQFVLIFGNFGFTSSLIYQKELHKRDLPTCWWGNLGVDTGVALICVGIAAVVHSRGDIVVANVIFLLALQFVITSIGRVNEALMRRAFRYRDIAIRDLVGAVVSFASAWYFVRWLGWGVYGLAGGLLLSSVVMAGMNLYFVPWLPSWSFSREAFKKHIGYGRWFVGVGVVTFANNYLDRIIIGSMLSTAQLGFFEYAQRIPMLLSDKLAQVLNSVLFSAFSRLQDDTAELRRLLERVYRYNSLVLFPLLFGIALVGPEFIQLAFGEKWMTILEPMRLLCLFGALRLYAQPLWALCNGVGKPNYPFLWAAIYLPLNVVVLYLGAKYGGVAGVAAMRLTFPIFFVATLGVQIMKLLKVPWSALFAATVPAWTASAVMAACVIGAHRFDFPLMESVLFRLIFFSVLGAASYVAALAIGWPGELRGLFRFLTNLRQPSE